MMVEGVSAANKNPQDSLGHVRGLIRYSIDFTMFVGLLNMLQSAFDKRGKAASESNLRVDGDEGPPPVTHASTLGSRGGSG